MIRNLRARLDATIARHGAPGAVIAIWADGRLRTAAAGLANVAEDMAMTPDALVQIGSVTKPFTATLALQQVAAGALDLDSTVRRYLPDLRVADMAALEQVTIRRLLAHTSGLDGDLLLDTGRGPDALALLMDRLSGVAQLHPPGAFFSYCNLGYNILGRVLEAVSGQAWDEMLAARILAPLGLRETVTSAEGALRRRFAVGHVKADDGWRVAEGPFRPRSNCASGCMMAATAADLVTFGRLHLGDHPRADDILPRALRDLMRAQQVGNPFNEKYAGWGLGWTLFEADDDAAFGHDGGVAGACAFLRILPRRGAVVALLVNGANGLGAWRDIGEPLIHDLDPDTPAPVPYRPATQPEDFAPYAGRYARFGQAIDITVAGQHLAARLHGEYEPPAGVAFTLAAQDHARFSASVPGLSAPVAAHFHGIDAAGRPAFLHITDRVFPRVTEGP